MQITLATIALMGAAVWAQDTTSTSTSSSSTTSGSSTITSTNTIPSVGAVPNGPAQVAFSYCFPSRFPSVATDTPCYSMRVLNQACYYGPSVFQTATATPTATASPKDQQDCYCNEASGVGYMYFQFMEGCSNCFREHGALGSYGAYNKEFISSLSSSYCAEPSPTRNYGVFLTSFQANKVTPTADASTSNVLGTRTDVSLYYTTRLIGGFANATSNSTSYGTGTRGVGPTGGVNVTVTSASLTATGASSSSPTSGSTAAASATSAGAGAQIVIPSAFGALLLGLAAML